MPVMRAACAVFNSALGNFADFSPGRFADFSVSAVDEIRLQAAIAPTPSPAEPGRSLTSQKPAMPKGAAGFLLPLDNHFSRDIPS